MSVSNAKLVAMVGALWIVVILGAGYMVATHFLTGQAAAAHTAPQAEPPPAPGPMYVLKERVINLTDPGGRRYLKAAMTIEFGGGAQPRKASPEERKQRQAEFDKEIALWTPVIEDAVIGLVSARSSTDISTPEGKQRLKNDIREAINGLLGEDRVTNIYFTQFVMQ